MKRAVVIVGAGWGKRMKTKIPKQFLKLNHQSVLEKTVNVFNRADSIDEIILVTQKKFISPKEIRKEFSKVKKITEGGETRQESVFRGLKKLSSEVEIVLIHDAVRPFVSPRLIWRVVRGVIKYGACVPGILVKETIKKADSKGVIKQTLDRRGLWLIQTPQGFYKTDLLSAYKRAKKLNYLATDDAQLIENWGRKVKIIKGEISNIKITTKADFRWAKFLGRK
jgi:2-C-methyl-D-erythritol 4-phosphate cytidylyltransferase